jgi:hypothetical protein
MVRWLTLLVAFVLVGLGSARGQAPGLLPETAEPPADLPTLRGVIAGHLQTVPGLRPADGVRVEDVTFSEGVITLRGTVASAEQRERVLREVEGLRRTIERTLDVRVRSVQSQLDVRAPASPSREGPRPGEQREVAPPAEEGLPCEEAAGPPCGGCGLRACPSPWVSVADDGINAFTDPNCLDKKHLHHKRFRTGKK